MKFAYLAPLILLFVSACDAPAPVAYPQIRFAERSSIKVDVQEINIENDYKATLKPPYVDHLSPVRPEQAIAAWVADRLQATGDSGSLLVNVKNASIKEEKLQTTPGLKGAFTKDQASKFTATVNVELRIYGDRAISLANTNVTATRFATLKENASLAERDQLLYNLTAALMEDLNAELEKNIQMYFSNYLDYSSR